MWPEGVFETPSGPRLTRVYGGVVVGIDSTKTTRCVTPIVKRRDSRTMYQYTLGSITNGPIEIKFVNTKKYFVQLMTIRFHRKVYNLHHLSMFPVFIILISIAICLKVLYSSMQNTICNRDTLIT